MIFNPDHPIIIAFAGMAGAGKTSTANAIVPKTSSSFNYNLPEVVWDHLYFAMPIYDMVHAKTHIEGDDYNDRLLYSLHDIVYDLLQRRCSYEDCIELVYDLFHLPCEMINGEKPRTFMQTAGDYCRSLYQNCFAEKAIKTINNRFNQLDYEYDLNDHLPPIHFNIISDLRMKNELDIVRSQPNNLVIKFVADRETLDQRLIERSGRALTTEQQNHQSESELLTMDDDEFDIIVDTTKLEFKDQVSMVKEAITQTVGEKV